MDYDIMRANIQQALKKYVEDNKLKALVLGISGGIDSAVCAALALPVCKELDIPLVGRSIPIIGNKSEEVCRADLVGDAFCTDFRAQDRLDVCFMKLEERLLLLDYNDRNSLIRKGNVKARIRMIYLYDLAQKFGGMVLSTDNLTELYLGFWTLHGDVGNYGMIQNLWKMEVYGLAAHLSDSTLTDKAKNALNSCIDAVPTDGLGITDSDLDQLGVKSYEEVDRRLKLFLGTGESEPDCPIIKRYQATMFKRHDPVSIPRETIIGKD